jgi:Icc-related predicted phosphoesterase
MIRCVSEGELRIVGLVDLHWSGRAPLRLPDLAGTDLVLLGGDLTNFRGREIAREIVDELRALGVAVLAVCGNCDQPEIEEYLRAEEIDLDRRARVVGGVVFAGISGGLPFGGTPYERGESGRATSRRRPSRRSRTRLERRGHSRPRRPAIVRRRWCW